jgi:hypothetical protein
VLKKLGSQKAPTKLLKEIKKEVKPEMILSPVESYEGIGLNFKGEIKTNLDPEMKDENEFEIDLT